MRLLVLIILMISFPISAVAQIHAKKDAACLLTKTLNNNEIQENAGLIFRGKYLGFKEARSANLAIRILNFEITEAIKGIEQTKKNLEIKEWAGLSSPFSNKKVSLEKEYVFYFHEPSDLGLSSLVGQRQGIKKVAK